MRTHNGLEYCAVLPASPIILGPALIMTGDQGPLGEKPENG